MRVAIIDDEKPSRSELSYLIEKELPSVAITEFSSGEEVLDSISKESYDLFCIDINLGDINGITLATTIRKIIPNAEIVFATAYNNYADKAFEIDAMYYLLKPFSEIKVRQMIERYKLKQDKNKRKNEEETVSRISLFIDKKFIMLDIEDIIYIESENRGCLVHTKKDSYKDNNTLNFFEDKLQDKGFFRIHKSFLINLKYIFEIHPWFNNTYCIKLEGFKDVLLPVSRNQIKDLKRILHLKH